MDHYTYPSGKKVITAFTANNFVLFDRAVNTQELQDNFCLDHAHKVKITWRIQKNCRNGQKITLSAEKTCHKYVLLVPLDEWYSVQDAWANLTQC